jgi:transcriptional regulator with XRE-family HTH domain
MQDEKVEVIFRMESISKTSNSLKRARIEKDITQSELAEKIGCSRIYIAKLETGKRKNPSPKYLRKIKDILGAEAITSFI